MHPAYSVILFTTASGAGYGLLFLLAVLRATGVGPAERWFGATALALALALITFGLLSSTVHLGRPERAWRAFSQWRSSWLSREGIASVATYVPALALGVLIMIPEGPEPLARIVAVFTTVCAAVTVWCTAKIYSSLATIRQWENALVPWVYLTMALASGAVLLTALLDLFGMDLTFSWLFATAAVAAALLTKLAYWRSIDREPPRYSMAQATGLGRETGVRQWEVPHTSENFVMKEMGYRVAREHARKLRRMVIAAFIATILLVLLSAVVPEPAAIVVDLLAVIAIGFGVLVERWLFFAEATHVAMLYYGVERA
jgi:sulfite dehydrogenase (quinone) subunit SoeC